MQRDYAELLADLQAFHVPVDTAAVALTAAKKDLAARQKAYIKAKAAECAAKAACDAAQTACDTSSLAYAAAYAARSQSEASAIFAYNTAGANVVVAYPTSHRAPDFLSFVCREADTAVLITGLLIDKAQSALFSSGASDASPESEQAEAELKNVE